MLKIPDVLRPHDHTKMLLLALLVGVLGGFGAVGFRGLITLVMTVFFGGREDFLLHIQTLSWPYIVFPPFIGGLIVGPLVYFFAREAKGHGVPEVMKAVALDGGVIRKRIVVVKALASAISIGSGMSVGREGPIVQVGSAIGSTLGQLTGMRMQAMRTLVGCGAAAGIAATFNAPIAGCIFAVEIILGDFAVATFSPIVVSSVMATVISRHYLGDIPAFEIPEYKLVSYWEYPLYAILGILVAILGVVFITVLYKSEDLVDRIKFPEYLKPAVGGLIVGGIGIQIPYVMGVGYETMNMALFGQLSMWMLLLLAGMKIVATSVTLSFGGSGGVFAPSLYMGACFGGAFGAFVNSYYPESTGSIGAYSLVGMGAMVAATTHAPITAILILFELSGNYTIILPLMLSCIVSTAVATRIKPDSIYTLKLLRRGIDLKRGKEVNVLRSLKVIDGMSKKIETLPEDMRLQQLLDTMQVSPYQNYPVLDAEGNLSGLLSFQDLRPFMFEQSLLEIVVVKDAMRPNVRTIAQHEDLETALKMMDNGNVDLLPVVNANNPRRIVGVLSRTDVVSAYNRAVLRNSAMEVPQI